MAFFEELGKTLSDTGKEVATKAKTLTETIQLKTQLTAEKSKLEEAYAVIGKIYYKANREPEEEYAKAYEAVRASRERVAALEIELTQSEGSRICAVCGAKVPKDFMYCGKCGSPISEESEAPEEYESADDVTAEDDETESAVEETAAAVETDCPFGVPAAEEEAFVESEEK